MKLTEIAIDGYQGTHHTHLQNLGSGLNVVHSPHSATCHSICNFIPDILYGPDRQGRPTTMWPSGYLQVQSGGHDYRLTRPPSHYSNDLAISDIRGGQPAHRTPELLSRLDPAAYATFFHIPLDFAHESWATFVNQLQTHFALQGDTLSSRMPFSANREGYQAWKREADSRTARLDSVLRQLAALENEKSRLLAEQARHLGQHQTRLSEIDVELSQLQTQSNSATVLLREEQGRLAELDHKIAELRELIRQESSRLPLATNDSGIQNALQIYYTRLDEVDHEIRRWRAIQSDIQNQRLRLRDEMVTNGELRIDSHEHPYHDSQEILSAVESRISQVETMARPLEPAHDPAEKSAPITTVCREIRDDLQALCNELGRQYKHVRHKAAVAELKHLRRYFHQTDENVKRLLIHRDAVLEELRQLDAVGAEAILIADPKFLHCAEQEGYLVARQRLLTANPLPQWRISSETCQSRPALTEERARLNEWQKLRTTLVDRIATQESQIRTLESRRQGLLDERLRLQGLMHREHETRIRDIDAEWQPLESERSNLQAQIEADQPWLRWQPNYLLTDANRYLHQLSHQSLTQVGLDGDQLKVRNVRGTTSSVTQLTADEQAMIRLALSLAAVDQLALRGVRLPILVEDTQQRAAYPTLIPVLASFCRNGHQLMLLTQNRHRIEQSADLDVAIFELPDTSITSPAWHPETPEYPQRDAPRSGSFHHHYQYASVPPMNPIPAAPVLAMARAAGASVATPPDAERFIPTPLVASPRSACTRHTMLQDIDLVESIYLTPMESLGVCTVGQLLDLDLDRYEIELTRRGFNLDQIDRWQAQAYLLIHLPDLHAAAARVLVGSGLDHPELLLQSDSAEIQDRIRRYLDSSAGRRSSVACSYFSQTRLREWAERLANQFTVRERPLDPPQHRAAVSTLAEAAPRTTERSSENRNPRKDSARKDSARNNSSSHQTNALQRPEPPGKKSKKPEYRFNLNVSDPLDAAPSIGPRTAQKFHKLDIYTVQEFLDSDIQEMAQLLDNRRLSAKVLQSWQDQARLMCAVPNLRGHDVQLLVHCEIVDPAALASMNAEDLWQVVEPAAGSRDGARILRNSEMPDFQEVAGWIDAANHLRPLKAA